MSEHGREHEELLERILACEPDAADPGARAALEACPECARELARLGALAARMRALADEERGILARAAAEAGTGDEERVRNALAKASRAAAASRTRRLVLALAAAAAFLIVGWVARGILTRERPDEVLLGEGEIECEIEPDFSEFRWSYPLPRGGQFTLTIYVREDEGRGNEVLSIPLTTQRWTPSAAQRQALPDRIMVEIDAYRAGEETPIASGRCAASR